MSANKNSRSVSNSRLIEVVKSHPDPAVKASEVAAEVGLTDTRVNQILGELEKEGLVKSKRFGSGKAWWVPDRTEIA